MWLGFGKKFYSEKYEMYAKERETFENVITETYNLMKNDPRHMLLDPQTMAKIKKVRSIPIHVEPEPTIF